MPPKPQPPPWMRPIATAFDRDEALQHRIFTAATSHAPTELQTLFTDIANYILSPPPPPSTTPTTSTTTINKKRKLNSPEHSSPLLSILECKDISLQIPARKKLSLRLVASPQSPTHAELQLFNPQTSSSSANPTPDFSLQSRDIEAVFCLPVPEKQARQWNFCFIPRTAEKGGGEGGGGGEQEQEQIVFTVGETKPIGVKVEGRESEGQEEGGGTLVEVVERGVEKMLKPWGLEVVRPEEAEFASGVVQAHRRGEKGWHVRAHRGTKEGYLFFLKNGIVFGFRKPVVFFPFAVVQSISYTSVLQRTFNLVVMAMEGEEAKEMEFSMLDQTDFGGIDEYVKRHQLNDASMAAERRAKAYNVNKEGRKAGANGEVGNGGEEGGEEQTELQKAEQQLQDEEDEEEEDYEASGGDSDGEGEDSDEEGEGDGEMYEDEEGYEYDEEEEGAEEHAADEE